MDEDEVELTCVTLIHIERTSRYPFNPRGPTSTVASTLSRGKSSLGRSRPEPGHYHLRRTLYPLDGYSQHVLAPKVDHCAM